jgi:pimeloyl-ACP methyl ester carboxylesterase
MKPALRAIAIALFALLPLAAGAQAIAALVRPAHALADEAAPPAPDYRDPRAWLAAPSIRDGGNIPPADVFFVHPTTYLSRRSWNARFDEAGETERRLTEGVLRMQASSFEACCRVFAPRYRQATLAAFLDESADAYGAIDRAYGDVVRAFEDFVERRNGGRPFIVAGHSQGSLHALRLLLQRIVGTARAARLVAAYVVGGTVPLEIEAHGLPVCRTPTQTGCLVAWNSVQAGSDDPRRRLRATTWLDGRYQPIAGRPLVCVNPLDWRLDSSAGPESNLGALPRPAPGEPLPATVAQLTGAACRNGLLGIDIAPSRRAGFSDALTAAGNYHDFDYNLFYMNIRANAQARVEAFLARR